MVLPAIDVKIYFINTGGQYHECKKLQKMWKAFQLCIRTTDLYGVQRGIGGEIPRS